MAEPASIPAPRKTFHILKDPAFITLVLTNGLMIFFYEENMLMASNIIFTYYVQSLLIGLLHFIRIAGLKDFVPDDDTQSKTKSKWTTAIFFCIHYGGFHFGYFIFLIPMLTDIPGRVDLMFFGTMAFAFLAGGIVELRRHLKTDRVEKPNIGTLLFLPYARLIPMHIFIVFAFTSFEPQKFLYFLLLKALADLITYAFVSKSWKAPSVFRVLQKS